GRRARAGRDRFRGPGAGLAQVDVDVDEPRADDLARAVHALRCRGRLEALSDALDLALGDQHILHAVRGVCRVDDAAVLDEQTHGASPLLPASRSNTPIRTATPFVTWSRITEYGPSATSGESSMPRLTGPGCMINTSGRAWLASFSTWSPPQRAFGPRSVRSSGSACVGCSCAPSPACTIEHGSVRASSSAAPAEEWRTMTTSGLIAAIVFAVSMKLSPFVVLEPPAEKLMTSAESHLPAISNEVRVRVDGS